jgi:hypothetical protein
MNLKLLKLLSTLPAILALARDSEAERAKLRSLSHYPR